MNREKELELENSWLREQIELLMGRMAWLESDNLQFKTFVHERISEVERNVDEVYYTKGAQLVATEQARLSGIHQIVLDVFELVDEDDSIFYGKMGRWADNPMVLVARETLIYVLKKNIQSYNYNELEGIYQRVLTSHPHRFKKHLENERLRPDIDEADRRVQEFLKQQRPYDDFGTRRTGDIPAYGNAGGVAPAA